MMEQDAAPAGKLRKLALGRPRDPPGRHYDRSAGSLLDWDWPACLVPGSSDPGTEKPRWRAERRHTFEEKVCT